MSLQKHNRQCFEKKGLLHFIRMIAISSKMRGDITKKENQSYINNWGIMKKFLFSKAQS